MNATIITDPDRFDASAGAYALIISLAETHTVRAPARRINRLPPGIYLYAGNAGGPGGLRARILRHLRHNKRPHWHIDQLTGCGDVIAVGAFLEYDECGLISWTGRRLGGNPPIPGFGSSDCRTCRAHLLSIPSQQDWVRILADMGADTIWLRPCAVLPAGA